MSVDDGGQGAGVVPSASFSRLSATNVVFGRTWAQLAVGVAGLAIMVAAFVAGMNLPLAALGVAVMAFGLARWQGLSAMAWAWIWLRWRSRCREGTNRWAYSSALAEGRPLGVLGLWPGVEDRLGVVEGDGVEAVGTRFEGCCYLWDAARRQATAVLTASVREWTLAADRDKADRAAGLCELLADLAETPGFNELKCSAMVLPQRAPVPPAYADGDGVPDWVRKDIAELWRLPAVLTPMGDETYVSVSVDADRLGVRRSRGERADVGDALGGLVRSLIAPGLAACGCRPGTIRWCGVDDLRDVVARVADPAHAHARPRVGRDEPTVTYMSEEADMVTLESCVARSFLVIQWPDRPVPAGWTRTLLSDRESRMMGVCHVWRPMTMAKSEHDLANREASIEQRARAVRPAAAQPRRTARRGRAAPARPRAGGELAGHRPPGVCDLVRPGQGVPGPFRRGLPREGTRVAPQVRESARPAARRAADDPASGGVTVRRGGMGRGRYDDALAGLRDDGGERPDGRVRGFLGAMARAAGSAPRRARVVSAAMIAALLVSGVAAGVYSSARSARDRAMEDCRQAAARLERARGEYRGLVASMPADRPSGAGSSRAWDALSALSGSRLPSGVDCEAVSGRSGLDAAAGEAASRAGTVEDMRDRARSLLDAMDAEYGSVPGDDFPETVSGKDGDGTPSPARAASMVSLAAALARARAVLAAGDGEHGVWAAGRLDELVGDAAAMMEDPSSGAVGMSVLARDITSLAATVAASRDAGLG